MEKLTYQLPLRAGEDVDQPTIKPPLIDTTFDVDLANSLARLESFNRHLYRPNSYLHKWWARRCGTTFRTILKHLAAHQDEFDFYAPGGLEGLIILDPMMGGGTTLHEAIRLGASVVGFDIDPIPVLQVKASLSHIPLITMDLQFKEFFQSVFDDLEGLFTTNCPTCDVSTDILFTLFGLSKSCECDTYTFLDSFTFRYESDDSKWVICPECSDVYRQYGSYSNHVCNSVGLTSKLRVKGQRSCAVCDANYSELLNLPYHKRYQPIAVVGECKEHGLFFKKPTRKDLHIIDKTNNARSIEWVSDQSLFHVSGGPKSNALINRNISSYLDVFTSRQLRYLESAHHNLGLLEKDIRLNIGMLISTSTEFNSLLCGYKGGAPSRPGAIRHVFSHHAYSFPHTAVENNPAHPSKSSGTLLNLFNSRIVRARTWAMKPKERKLDSGKADGYITIVGEIDQGTEVKSIEKLRDSQRHFMVMQRSSVDLPLPDESIDHVVTDPPYFDNVQYGNLSEFFRVWLRQFFPDEMDWDYDISKAAVNNYKNGDTYEDVLSDIFSECNRVLKKPYGRLVFTFHHWRPAAWAALTNALSRAKFRLANYYIVHSENSASVHISNLNSLEHDAILVLKPNTDGNGQKRLKVDAVNTRLSSEFTKDCAAALAWMLDSELTPREIRSTWQELIPVS